MHKETTQTKQNLNCKIEQDRFLLFLTDKPTYCCRKTSSRGEVAEKSRNHKPTLAATASSSSSIIQYCRFADVPVLRNKDSFDVLRSEGRILFIRHCCFAQAPVLRANDRFAQSTIKFSRLTCVRQRPPLRNDMRRHTAA